MLLTEYDEQKAMQLFKEEGYAQGIAEGENKFGRLVKELLDQGRYDDALKAATDKKAMEMLYKEFNIL